MPLELVLLLFLALLSIQDIKTQQISLLPILFIALLGLLRRGFLPTLSLTCYLSTSAGLTLSEILPSLLPGIFSLCLSLITRQGIGTGDSLLILSLGFLLELRQLLCLLFGGILCADIVALILLFRHHSIRTAFPFLPSLALSYVLGLFLHV